MQALFNNTNAFALNPDGERVYDDMKRFFTHFYTKYDNAHVSQLIAEAMSEASVKTRNTRLRNAQINRPPLNLQGQWDYQPDLWNEIPVNNQPAIPIDWAEMQRAMDRVLQPEAPDDAEDVVF
jgi:hypothetical protein